MDIITTANSRIISIEQDRMSSKEKNSQSRVPDQGLLAEIVSANPPITITEVTNDGRVSFTVSLVDLNLKKKDISQSSVGVTRFFANFFGEYIVRRNLDTFVDIMVKMGPKEYEKAVTAFEHGNFGMFISNEKVKFYFHISLVEDIMNEDLVRIIG